MIGSCLLGCLFVKDRGLERPKEKDEGLSNGESDGDGVMEAQGPDGQLTGKDNERNTSGHSREKGGDRPDTNGSPNHPELVNEPCRKDEKINPLTITVGRK